MLDTISITIGRYWTCSWIHEKQKKSRIPSHPTKNCSPPYFPLKRSIGPPLLVCQKNSSPPFIFLKKTSCPLFFRWKKLVAPFFSLKKTGRPLFFSLKKSRRPLFLPEKKSPPPVDKPGPGTPINFGRSLMPVTFSPEITRFTLWLSQHQVPATFFTIKLYVPYVDVP